MKIKADPRAKRLRAIKDVLQRHEWLFLQHAGPPINKSYIDYDLLSELVYDLDTKMQMEDAG